MDGNNFILNVDNTYTYTYWASQVDVISNCMNKFSINNNGSISEIQKEKFMDVMLINDHSLERSSRFRLKKKQT